MTRVAAGPLALIGILGAGTLAAQTPDPIAIVRRAGAAYRGLTSLQADFVQVIRDPGLGDTLSSTGKLYQSGDNAFAMRFSDPPNEAIVIDGQFVWVYTPSTNPGQVIRMRMETDPVYGVNLLARILDRPADRYTSTWLRADTLSRASGGRDCHRAAGRQRQFPPGGAVARTGRLAAAEDRAGRISRSLARVNAHPAPSQHPDRAPDVRVRSSFRGADHRPVAEDLSCVESQWPRA